MDIDTVPVKPLKTKADEGLRIRLKTNMALIQVNNQTRH